MIRRTLQFVLLLTVLFSTSAAQAYAMPCCQLKAPVIKAAAPVHHAAVPQNSMAAMHCHGDMQQAQRVAAPLPHCESNTCSVRSDVAAAPTEEAALQTLVDIAATTQHVLSTTRAAALHARNILSHPPDPHQQTPLPLRV